MGSAVDQPRRVIRDDEADEDAPNDPGPTAQKEERPREHELKRKTQMLQHPVERIGRKIRSVTRDLFVRRHIHVLEVEPIDVRPAKAEPDVMRITFVVGVGVMLAMNGDPTNRIALERERSKDGKKIFE